MLSAASRKNIKPNYTAPAKIDLVDQEKQKNLALENELQLLKHSFDQHQKEANNN